MLMNIVVSSIMGYGLFYKTANGKKSASSCWVSMTVDLEVPS